MNGVGFDFMVQLPAHRPIGVVPPARVSMYGRMTARRHRRGHRTKSS
ncbi:MULTISPECIES: hypothetical protein [unclassified Streptomyces]